MCTAQVLLHNRDVMRRNFGDVNRRVCRKLFETPDPNPVGPAVFLKKMQEEIRKRDAERWNFDFFSETPLPGRYQWEPVFTSASKSNSSKKQSTTTSESNPDDRVQQAVVEPIVEEIHKIPKTKTQPKKKTGAGASSQHKITDFMTKKRRSTEDSSSSKLKVRKVSRNSESLTTTTRLR